MFTGVDGLLNLGGSTSPLITNVINPPGGGGGGSGANQPAGVEGTVGSGGFVVPPPLDAAVRAANQSSFFVEGFVLALEPLMANPAGLAAVLSALSSELSGSTDPNVGLLFLEEFHLFSDLAAYINNPSAYQPNLAQTVALANQVRSDAAPILFNPALGSSYSAAVLGGMVELFLMTGNNPQAAAPEQALSQLAPALL